ncbi:hypothetical protein IAI10_21815 [Clostridium sp. 19966]|uniref:hypothetical protein n=1 Tax=Clostridium sp. 19966 TaxID=2768166 RepID=UPI0028DE3AE7|nr:hypothetical protein [Clostridium sp. 19966]MDT8719294.1 hypothetical protein [Clostridium sp. 19966]
MNNIDEKVKASLESDKAKNNIEVWEDLVSIKELVISIIVCSLSAFGGYFLAPKERPKQLLLGLLGALIGFILCSIIIKPKREFIEVHQED